ncbi:MAG: PHP domain-containing protein, partial [Pseudomonadota bacterium]
MNAPVHPADFDTPSATAPRLRDTQFVHLKVHSSYSLLEGALPIGKLVDLAKGHALPAVALTDTGNLFGILEFSEKMAKAGIQPIAGLSLSIDFEERLTDGFAAAALGAAPPQGDGRIALLAMDEAGYQNLMKLASRAYFDVDDASEPHVAMTRLAEFADGLIALSGGPEGPIDTPLRDGQTAVAAERLGKLHRIFGDRLYVEVQRHGTADEARVEPALLDLAYDRDVGIVATNEVYFATPSDHEAHDALTCIADGRYVVEDDRRRLTPD